MKKVKVSSHTAKRGSKTVTVREHTKTRFRTVNSSFIDRVSQSAEGGYVVTIKGKDYPYPYMPSEKVAGLVSGRGKYYNKNIRGNYF